ncbi:hypothetical protein [Pseudomonas sp. P8_250]|uniref:hypothetical protein n=1 Tax=Pseudomonas sp. P8_250 TaxID=3043446 RepID=UPI002A363FAD|nr:hypothetical protein [Pseudomonas sp. P8_250]MDX9668722.1 hypothetical protein [Pseudomonas sp. P8_250]
MRTYRVVMCNKDGSTPPGAELEFLVKVTDTEDRFAAAVVAYDYYPNMSIVSVGWIEDVEAYERARANQAKLVEQCERIESPCPNPQTPSTNPFTTWAK